MWTDQEIAKLRAEFERQARDSFDFKRSRRGTYINPAVARDWKWFLLGAATRQELLKTALNRLEDILKQDDPQAYKEAQRFLEMARKETLK